jgi:thiamine-monophosphate kinase
VAARRALDAHRRPEPRCEVGLWLAARGRAQAMLDLSDGLSADLPRLCRASGTGAEVDAWRLPLFEPARSWGFDPLELGLHGGEDFELLFAVRPEAAAALERAYPGRFPPLSRIGRLTPGRGIRSIAAPGARARPLPQLGFDHFRRAAGVRRRRA